MKYTNQYIKTLFAFLLIIGAGSVYAGCNVVGTITAAKLTTAATNGDDITTCDVSAITGMNNLFENNVKSLIEKYEIKYTINKASLR
jgi:hypothetical protein